MMDCVDPATKTKRCVSWYHQRPGEAPRLLIYYTSDRPSGVSTRFSGTEKQKKIDFALTISDVQAQDSGVYYCLFQHTPDKGKTWVFPQ
ncbi:hypothetical protein ACEWY4_001789 [Coilia grayii]|uniref:Ig-like domain-containing protein n=1 Tax=Coilia grayii TaxID=363190 RepID=A0ABD1KUE2_9TELE